MTTLGRPRSLPRRIFQAIDWVLVTLVAGIVTLALINLNSAGAGDWTGKIQTQIRWLGLGTIAAACVAALDYRVLADRIIHGTLGEVLAAAGQALPEANAFAHADLLAEALPDDETAEEN